MEDQLRALQLRLGRTIKRLRVERGWSQEDLSERMERVGRKSNFRHLGLVERGKGNARLDLLLAIAIALKVEFLDLFGGPSGQAPSSSASVAPSPPATGHRISEEDVDQLSKIVKRVKRSGGRDKSERSA